MEWISDPAVWIGLLTLVVLEVVLGIDNLVFIAILADKLPPGRRERARVVGLLLALVMRLGLLGAMSWVMALTAPVLEAWRFAFSWRDLILIAGGIFLLVKATTEIHERLEAPHAGAAGGGAPRARFWAVVAQIVILDAVFSLDSVITAVGMVDELPVMMAAVVIAVLAMLLASRPLTAFVTAHPTLIILCLGFLLMIGLVLVVDGFGLHIPKGYVYAAIGFSVLIETLNQVGARNRRRAAERLPARQRVADAVLRMLGGVPLRAAPVAAGEPPEVAGSGVFRPAERHMMRGVLGLAERPVTTVMTPRTEVAWLDSRAPREEILGRLRGSPHSGFPVAAGSLDDLEGVARKDEVLALCLEDRPFDLRHALREPLSVPEGVSALDALGLFKRSAARLALVVDEYGSLRGVVTPTDVLEAIAGDLASPGDTPAVETLADGSLSIDAAMAAYDLQERLGLPRLPEGEYDTAAGLVLALFERIPSRGEQTQWDGWVLEVAEADGARVTRLLARRAEAARPSPS